MNIKTRTDIGEIGKSTDTIISAFVGAICFIFFWYFIFTTPKPKPSENNKFQHYAPLFLSFVGIILNAFYIGIRTVGDWKPEYAKKLDKLTFVADPDIERIEKKYAEQQNQSQTTSSSTSKIAIDLQSQSISPTPEEIPNSEPSIR